MDFDLAGRTAVVTGGSRGIGLAVVGQLAACGARVFTGAKRSSAGDRGAHPRPGRNVRRGRPG